MVPARDRALPWVCMRGVFRGAVWWSCLMLGVACGGDDGGGDDAGAWAPGDTDGTGDGDGGGNAGADAGDGSGGGGGATASTDDGGGASCEAGDVQDCACPDGEDGLQVCDPDTGRFGTCMCGDGPSDPTDDPPDPATPTGATEVCYPGADGAGTTCLPIHFMSPMPEGYTYPAAFDDDPNYRPPLALIDLEEVDPNTALAPNFVLSEVAQAEHGRYAVVQPHAIASLQALRDAVGTINITSGYRSPADNEAFGGSPVSRHLYGDGFDMQAGEVAASVLEAACTDGGGMLLQYTTHVHCDFRFEDLDVDFFGTPGPGSMDEPAFGATIVEVDTNTFEAPADGFDEGTPTRHWLAFDVDGHVLATGSGTRFEAPRATARVEVEVGRLLVRTHELR